MNQLIGTRTEKRQLELGVQIEHKRKQMIAIGMEKGFAAKETVQYSQELDILLNEYQHMEQPHSTTE